MTASPGTSAAHGFRTIVMACAADDDFVANFDRLTKSNLRGRGSGLDLAIDDATGRLKADAALFVAFVFNVVWSRLPTGAPS